MSWAWDNEFDRDDYPERIDDIPAFRCDSCGQDVMVGEDYYVFRIGDSQFRVHCECADRKEAE